MVLCAALPGLDPLTGGEVLVAQNVAFAVIGLTMVLFILLGAEFVAVTQVLVYIGAIVVLFLFGIMLTRGSYGTDEDVGRERHLMAALVGVLVLGVTAGSLVDTFRDAELARSAPSTTAQIGDSIFGQYIVPFEAISVLLLAALIGAVVVARSD